MARSRVFNEALVEPSLVPIDHRKAPARDKAVVVYCESLVCELLGLFEAPSVLSHAYIDVCELGVGLPKLRLELYCLLEQTASLIGFVGGDLARVSYDCQSVLIIVVGVHPLGLLPIGAPRSSGA
jgi:hypothetical protein